MTVERWRMKSDVDVSPRLKLMSVSDWKPKNVAT